MKKLLNILLLTCVYLFFIVLPISAAPTLWNFFQEKGQELPSLNERSFYYSKIADDTYYGTFEQNVALLDHFENYESPLGTSIPQVVAVFETSLASKITSSQTTMTLVSGTTDDSTTLSGIYGFVIDEGSASQEFVIATCADTACTGMSRGISTVTGTSTVASLQKEHRRGATVKITDHPVLLTIINILTGKGTLPSELIYASGISSTTIAAESDGNVIPNRDYVTNLADQYAATSTFWVLGSNLTDIYYTTGNVGIGTTSPENLLDIREVDGTTAIRVFATSGDSNNLSLSTSELIMGRSSGSNVGMDIKTSAGSWGTANNAGDMIFSPDSTEALRIDKGGNVGIGSSTPDSTLSIGGTLKVTATGTFQGYVELEDDPVLGTHAIRRSWGDTYYLPEYSFGASSKSNSAGTQTIAHGLSTTPDRIKITAGYYSGAEYSRISSTGIFDGTSYSTISEGKAVTETLTNRVAKLSIDENIMQATSTLDSTNINLIWTEASTFPGTLVFIWEAWIN